MVSVVTFEWDRAKEALSSDKHGVDFAGVPAVFWRSAPVVYPLSGDDAWGGALAVCRVGWGWRVDGALHVAGGGDTRDRDRLLAEAEENL